MEEDEVRELEAADGSGERIALRWQAPSRQRWPGYAILYLHGFGSSQPGEKAQAFRSFARASGLPFASLDFRGHGASGGCAKRVRNRIVGAKRVRNRIVDESEESASV